MVDRPQPERKPWFYLGTLRGAPEECIYLVPFAHVVNGYSGGISKTDQTGIGSLALYTCLLAGVQRKEDLEFAVSRAAKRPRCWYSEGVYGVIRGAVRPWHGAAASGAP